ncbi:MAG: hypothetical protein AMXMBFR46_10770 [Acidimicrobiia bacterium]
MLRRGPGLVRGVARTAVVAGTASAVAGRVNRHQQQKWASQDQAAYEQQVATQQAAEPQVVYVQAPPAAAAPAAPSGGGDLASQLQQLADMQAQGILSAEEFEAAKAKLLAG